MFRTTIKGLMARKLRLVTTGLAVLLGVAFMSGTLVLTATVGRTFDNLFASVYAHTDAIVRSHSTFSAEGQDQRARVPESLLATVKAVPGVQDAEGNVSGFAQLVDKNGKAVGKNGNGPPTLGGNWNTVEALNPFNLVAGHEPRADNEVVIDKASADKTGYKVGDTATVLVAGPPQQVTISGIAKFGDANSPGGASYVLFTTAAAQRLIAQPGTFDNIGVVAAKGVSQEQVTANISKVLPPGTEALTGKAMIAETQDNLKQQLKFFNTFMLTFALIALFVGSFIIYNTFSILVAQRGREMALLRAVGATRRQVLQSVLIEATVVGLIAGVLGLFAGIGVAAGLKALLAGFGVSIPAGGVVLTANTVIVSLVAGVGVAVAAAYFPARKAAKVPPIAAMRDLAVETTGSSRKRAIAGFIVAGLGVGSLMYGLFGKGSNALANVGLGAMLTFVGVAILGPIIARPLTRLLGAPLPRIKGMTGTLARENALRNPKRTSSTAAALMIGLGLVSFITIFATSAKASFNASVDKSFTGSIVVDTGTFGFGGVSPDMAKSISALPEVKAASGMRMTSAQFDGATKFVNGVDPVTFPQIIDLGVTSGRLEDLGTNGLAISDTVAKDKHWKVGDPVTANFAKTGKVPMKVVAIFTDKVQTNGYVIGLPAYEANVADQFDAKVFVAGNPGVSDAQLRTAVESVTKAYPNATVQDRQGYKDSTAKQVDQILNFIYVMLALAIIIALIGIANTLALSIFERTRELGLLRAVGMTRSQLRSTVRWESVIIALFGTVLGLAIGLFFGWSLVKALNDQGINILRIPVGSLAIVTVLAALAGVAAAILPARRASKLNVLDAIATA
jgi:putative ABC transport system permease protein